jgi:2-dehydro-3-deoxyglucarate aldolase
MFAPPERARIGGNALVRGCVMSYNLATAHADMNDPAAPYQSFPNAFRRRLLAGETLFGCWCQLASPITTEILGLAGFDWLVLDGEHSPNEVTGFIPQLMALKDSASAPIVRPSWNDAVEIKRLLDAGFYNFLIPYVECADDAARAVAATRYPPAGTRGVSTSQRSNRYGAVAGYFASINEQIAVIVQIESRKGLDAAAAIAAVAGVDGLFVGPADLSAALGHLGDIGHLEVQAAIAEVFAAARAAGKPCGILAFVEAEARRYLAMGASFVAVGSDQSVLRSGTQWLRERYAPGA